MLSQKLQPLSFGQQKGHIGNICTALIILTIPKVVSFWGFLQSTFKPHKPGFCEEIQKYSKGPSKGNPHPEAAL